MATPFSTPPESPPKIAITAQRATAGVWEYSTNGGTTWTNISAVSTSRNCPVWSPGSAKLRFVPKKSFSGAVTLTAYAWDGTGNFNGAANLKSGIGGTTPFSAAPLVATCLVNSAPTLTP